MEIEKDKVDFNFLFKIAEINIETVKFIKYEISRNMSLINTETHTNISTKEQIGIETHRATVDVIKEIAGRTGELIKGFEVEKIGKFSIKVSKIKWLIEQQIKY